MISRRRLARTGRQAGKQLATDLRCISQASVFPEERLTQNDVRFRLWIYCITLFAQPILRLRFPGSGCTAMIFAQLILRSDEKIDQPMS